MAVSGSNDFEQQESTIIKDALIDCGGLEDDETPTSEQTEHTRRLLNRLCKAWSVKGLKAWCWNEVTLTLVAGTNSYTIGPSGDLTTERPLLVKNPRRVISSEETPIRIVSRQEYFEQPGKDDQGKPVMIYYDPQLTNGVLYVWPAPDAADSIKFSIKQYIEDFDASTNTPYFPPEWTHALVKNLAFNLCPRYEVTGEDRETLRLQAAESLQDAEDSDVDQGSLFLSPEYYY